MFNLIYGVSVRPLLFQPISELLVWLVVSWDVEDGGRWNVCTKKKKKKKELKKHKQKK